MADGLLPIGVGAVGLLVLVSAVWVVMLRNLFRAALSLGLVLVGIAVLFVLLQAEFLAFVQILVYVGAILVLVIFAIMLTSRLQGEPSVAASRHPAPAALFSVALFLILVKKTLALPWPAMPSREIVSLPQLGEELITTLILPFEVISLVFVVVMIGAVAIAISQHPPTQDQR